MPVFSTGGMRYQQEWNDLEPHQLRAESNALVAACIDASLSYGINHIETARGYGSSERQLGLAFKSLKRDELIVQTKIGIKENREEFIQSFETSMSMLDLPHVDLLSIHGINTREELARALDYAIPQMLEWRKQGRIRLIGFSTHGPADVIMQACFSGCFDYMNVHWYFINKDNWPAVQAAANQDMGVFIISPSDKGGRLWDPPEKLKKLCAPLTPMQFNDLFCLSHDEVHTLSLGASKPEDYDEHVRAMQWYEDRKAISGRISEKIHAEIDRVFGEGWWRSYAAGVPTPERSPGGLHIREILRLYTWAHALDMVDFAKSRYNMFGNGGAWFPGAAPGEFDEAQLDAVLQHSPHRKRIPGLLRDAHDLLKGEEVKRQSEEEKDDE